jgi:hypothetical protein
MLDRADLLSTLQHIGLIVPVCLYNTLYTYLLDLLPDLQIILSILFIQLHQRPPELNPFLKAFGDLLFDQQCLLCIFLRILETPALLHTFFDALIILHAILTL